MKRVVSITTFLLFLRKYPYFRFHFFAFSGKMVTPKNPKKKKHFSSSLLFFINFKGLHSPF